MRLADLLAETSLDDLERLAHEHAKAEEALPRPLLLATIESVLRSYRFIQDSLFNRQPPTFAIMTLLLEAPGFTLPTSEFRQLVEAETTRIAAALDARELLQRDDQLRTYRRVFYQARSNDMLLDPSELAILGVLRQELQIAQVEHFAIEHHADLREFWHQDGAFLRELHALRSTGILFLKEGQIVLPEDLAHVVRQVLGVEMSRDAARRLFQQLSSQDLHGALHAIGAPTSGSKEDRVERLVRNMAQPRAVLRGLGLDTLRDVCRHVGTSISGSKDDLVTRIVSHVGSGRDLIGEPEPTPPPAEPRELPEERFALLFTQLRGHELAAILGEFDLRRFGTKELQVQTLWGAQRSEVTLLSCLSNVDLDTILRRVDLKTGGSKAERIARLVSYFATVDTAAFVPPPPVSIDPSRAN